jgi:flagella basal body P-ring formation protein FlgA
MRIGHFYLVRTLIRLILVTVISVGFTFPSYADTARQQINDAIENAVNTRLMELFQNTQVRTDIKVNQFDARLKLAPCGKEVSVSLPPMQRFNRRTSAKVRCEAPTPWAIQVPVSIRAYKIVAVASNQLLRGRRISPNDIALAEMDIEKLKYGYFTQPEPILGMQLKRNLTVNAPFTPKLLRLPIVIQRGEQVTISAQASTLSVKTNGVALGSGTVGDKIPIRNLKSQRVVEGKIISAGHVAVNM